MNLESLQKTLESLSCSVYYSLSLSLSLPVPCTIRQKLSLCNSYRESENKGKHGGRDDDERDRDDGVFSRN